MLGNNSNEMKKNRNPKLAINGLKPAVNLISEGTVIQGEVHSNGDIRIDGTLKGVIHSKSKVVIGSSGNVDGNIYCDSADVLGKITGTIAVKDILYLKASAIIDGDIQTGKLIVESGATFNGGCSMGSKDSVKLNEERTVQKTREQAAV